MIFSCKCHVYSKAKKQQQRELEEVVLELKSLEFEDFPSGIWNIPLRACGTICYVIWFVLLKNTGQVWSLLVALSESPSMYHVQ